MPNSQIIQQSQPIFVIGSARSGTSIIAEAIKSGTSISGCNEGHFLPLTYFLMQELEQYYSKRKSLMNKEGFMISHTDYDDLEEKLIEIFRNTCDSFYQDQVWLDKTPDMGMIKAAPYLLRIWPESRFIFAKRRGMECINSRLRKFPHVPFKTHCKIWKTCMEIWLSVRDNLNDHYIEIDQREISIHPELMAQKIGNFLNLDNEKIEKIYNIFSHKRPESTGGNELPRAMAISEASWNNEQIDFFRKHCGTISEKYGYSESSSYYLSNVSK